ncbi:head completion/stabilization protein [Escherichia coli]|uniref:head completion/stabilization protein n=1 Tax=Escherichia coli TaxID=562 RepID=UPI0024B7B785|nr:head completion/stabilization protein [Escherichia coli]
MRSCTSTANRKLPPVLRVWRRPGGRIDGESIKVFYYERAVCAMATASLYERYRGVDASAKGDKRPTA